jgi:uncharacterized protein (DUF362 family)
MASDVERRALHIVDAVIAGHADGPLSPEPLAMKLLFAGRNAPAVDWVGAMLLGYAPEKIPTVRNAFTEFRWPLTNFAPNDIRLTGDLGEGRATDLLGEFRLTEEIKHPLGWRDAARQGGEKGAAQSA